MKSLTIYQLSLAEEAQRVSKNFQKEVLSSILYDKKFDSAKILIENFAFKKEKEALVKAYKDLGIYDDKLSEKIDNHILKLEQSIESYKQFKENKSVFTIDALLPLPLFKRTQHILDLSLKADEERKRIFEPIENFLDLLREFIKDKEINTNQSGFLIFKKDKREIPITELSSGEKQLLILLIETLVQRNKYFIFIADEPELSLHIEWQSKILNSIKKLNTNTQIIVATHSPEIAASRKKSLVNMEKIIYA